MDMYVCFSVDDSDVPADAWGNTPDFDILVPPPLDSAPDTSAVTAGLAPNGVESTFSSHGRKGAPTSQTCRPAPMVLPQPNTSSASVFCKPVRPLQNSATTAGRKDTSTSAMQLNVKESLTINLNASATDSRKVTNGLVSQALVAGGPGCYQASVATAAKAKDAAPTDDFFAALEREAAKRNF